jgi:hypothetical protein
MKHGLLFALILFSLSNAFGNSQTLLEESLYNSYQNEILSQDELKSKLAPGFSFYEQKIFVDALEDALTDKAPNAEKVLASFDAFHYDLVERLRLEIFKIKHGQSVALSRTLENELMAAMRSLSPDLRLIYIIAVYEQELLDAGHKDIVELAQDHPEYENIRIDRDSIRDLSAEVIADLFNKTPDMTTYMDGEYVKSVKIFMFCRDNRLYPCLMVMKDEKGDPIRENGQLWNHKSLASSKAGLPSYTRNGNTPSGVYTLDSVMPVADQVISYGRNRRIIVNFIPKSADETLHKRLLPASSQNHEWWQPAITARDIGRNLFRIHGTGKINKDPHTPYFPFMRTSGCIAQRENAYSGVVYNDQRILLDKIMMALGLVPSFANEIHVKGFLYLIEIDDKAAPVELADLNAIGIR